MDLTGKQIGRYAIKHKIGQGGMADVYLALDTQLEREVAFKIIRTEMFPPIELERILRRFKQEAKALAMMDHPNIIQVIDYGEYDGKPFLVMPYLPGGTLKDKLKGPMPWREAFKLMLPIVDAVGYAHKKDILHRDIKTSNILIRENGSPLITDFGVAKILTDPDSSISMTMAGIGTPNYMAPEQWIGKAEYASDQYSIGVMLYHMITGQLPFSADTPMAVMMKAANDPLPPARAYVRDLPKEVENFLIKMLMKDPKKRYGNLAQVESHMAGLLDQQKHFEQNYVDPPETTKAQKKSKHRYPTSAKEDGTQTIDGSVNGSNAYDQNERKKSFTDSNNILLIGFWSVVVIVIVYLGLRYSYQMNDKDLSNALLVTNTPEKNFAATATATKLLSNTPLPTHTEKPDFTNTPDAPFEYILQEGDNLWTIVYDKFDDEFGENGFDKLFELNPELVGGSLYPGQIILIPSKTYIVSTLTPLPDYYAGQIIEYTVRPGDLLADIAARFNSTTDDIISFNRITDANLVSAGTVLLIRANLVTPTLLP